MKKQSSKQYCFNNNPGNLHICVVSRVFITRFVIMCWFSKRWMNIQTHTKPFPPQSTPNTAPGRPHRLIISVAFDDFYRINQNSWCSTVGVFLIEIQKIYNFWNYFQSNIALTALLFFRNFPSYLVDCLRRLLKKQNFTF